MPPRFAPTKLSNWPWVVVRLDCVLCDRRGCYRLARLAARYGPEQDLAGLLRDLAHDCPWYNERPRKYAPRCGVRFTDLDHTPPPADDPGAPAPRQRQPGREDLPKPKGTSGSPPAFHGGAPTLADWTEAEMVLSCAKCGRRDVHVVADLRARMPPDTMLVNLRVTLSAGCPNRQGPHSIVQCDALLFGLGRDGTLSAE